MTVLAIEMKILKRTAHQKPLILNPSTRLSISIKIPALITRINRPKVRMVRGSVMSKMRGLINIFIRPNNMATPMAVQKLLIETPSSRYAPIKIIMLLISRIFNI